MSGDSQELSQLHARMWFPQTHGKGKGCQEEGSTLYSKMDLF